MENRRSQNDEVSRGVWETMETSAREIRVGEVKGRRSKGGSGKKERREREEEKTKKGKDNEGEEDSREMGNIG